jgi:hypothetical protein
LHGDLEGAKRWPDQGWGWDLDFQADIIEAQAGERPDFRRHGIAVIRNHRPDIAVVEGRAHRTVTP